MMVYASPGFATVCSASLFKQPLVLSSEPGMTTLLATKTIGDVGGTHIIFMHVHRTGLILAEYSCL
jgi:hypothetical protein